MRKSRSVEVVASGSSFLIPVELIPTAGRFSVSRKQSIVHVPLSHLAFTFSLLRS